MSSGRGSGSRVSSGSCIGDGNGSSIACRSGLGSTGGSEGFLNTEGAIFPIASMGYNIR